MDVERHLISIAIRERDLKPIHDAHIGEVDFEDDEHRAVFGWIIAYFEQYGEVPTAKAVHRNFPDYKLLRCEDSYQFYVDQKCDDIKRAKLWDTLEEARDSYAVGDLKGTIHSLSRGLEELHAIETSTSRVDITQTTDERYERYLELSEQEVGLRGVTTGFPSLDEITSGWREEQLVTVVGMSKAGKSTILLAMAMAAQEAGHTVTLFSFEMSGEEQEMRYDAMAAGINYLDLETGNLGSGALRAVQRSLRESSEQEAFYIEHDPSSSLTVSALGAKIAEEPTDLVIVDGVYLMEAQINADPGSPQALTQITRGLKRLAMQLHVPIIGSTQVLPGKYSRSRGINLGSIGWTSSFGQDSDIVIGVEETGEEDVLKLSVVGARNAPKRDLFVRRDWSTSTVEEHSESSDWNKPDEEDSDDRGTN